MGRTRYLMVLCVLLFQVAASAQSDDAAREQASSHFKRGVELFQDGAHRASLIEFERAYALAPDHRLLYNIAQVKFVLQDFIGTAQAYQQYLTEGGSAVPADRRQEVEAALAALRQRVGQIHLTVNRDGADVYLDDAEVGKTPIVATIPVSVGRHRITVRAPDGATASKVIDVAGTEQVEVSLQLADAPDPSETAAASAPVAPPLTVSRKLAIAGWSAGGAVLLGALTTGVMTLSSDRDLDDMFERANLDGARVDDQRDKTKRLATTTDALIITGSVLAVAGTALWLFGGRKTVDEDARPATAGLRWRVGPGALGVEGSF